MASGHLYAQSIHRVLKFYSVFASLDSVYLDTDNLYVILLENTCLCKL